MSARIFSLQQSLVNASMLSSIVAGLIALAVLMGLSGYHTLQLHDELMDEVADMLVMSDITQQHGAQIDELSEEFSIHYQLQTQTQVLTQSPDFQLPYLNLTPDFGFTWQQGKWWRRYVLDEHQMRAVVYQPMEMRVKDLMHSAGVFAAILLLLWCLQWVLVHFMIGRQFKSLKQLSHDIAQKSVHDLQPIHAPQPQFQELQPIVGQLNQLLGHLEHALTAEQRFTADASHELRSPLSAIQMRMQVLIRKYQQQAQLAQDLAPIQQDVARSTQILENLLLLARLDPTQVQDVPKTEFHLNDVVDEVIQALQPFIHAKHIQVHVQGSAGMLCAQRELIFTCLRNVLDNAIRYSPEQAQLHIRMQSSQVWIENPGPMLPEHTIVRLGERFYRALGTQTQGSGLGLSICHKIMQLHGGRIDYVARAQGGLKVGLIWR